MQRMRIEKNLQDLKELLFLLLRVFIIAQSDNEHNSFLASFQKVSISLIDILIASVTGNPYTSQNSNALVPLREGGSGLK